MAIDIADTRPTQTGCYTASPSQGQQGHDDTLLDQPPFIIFPYTVSRHSWNIVMNPVTAEGLYDVVIKEPFSVSTRLDPPRL
ncbi:hypothetical protein [Halomonas sp. PBN3]|uniref:hypothetical protein n=1 Tax=Halomonas sp. PBN3 TaxID=1397528 RepID=UPI0003B81D1B|nr:hypothetical protein [Halomonas sp. PBN3]ERS83850.1 hypothetical protein Q671_02605 [Halomonas sp. PBN3]